MSSGFRKPRLHFVFKPLMCKNPSERIKPTRYDKVVAIATEYIPRGVLPIKRYINKRRVKQTPIMLITEYLICLFASKSVFFRVSNGNRLTAGESSNNNSPPKIEELDLKSMSNRSKEYKQKIVAIGVPIAKMILYAALIVELFW